MTTIVFLDTETTGLDFERHEIWEVGLSVRNHREPMSYDGEWLWQMWPDLSKADPGGLRVGRFYERERLTGHAALKGRDIAPAIELASPWWSDEDRSNKNRTKGSSRREIAERLARILDGATLVGAVPDFDARFLSRFLPSQGQAATWHYHLVDVETLAAGRLRKPPPWSFDELLAEFGLTYDEADRHTALGDARMVRDLYDAVLAGEGK